MQKLAIVGLVSVLSLPAFARIGFPNNLPNGNNPPSGFTNCQMCHNAASGGTAEEWNDFGDAIFVANGGTIDDPATVDAALPAFVFWNADICGGDADGDGFTNGEELGDPDCTWTRGDADPVADVIALPGFADSTPDDAAEGEGEGTDPGGCSATETSQSAPLGALVMLAGFAARVSRRRPH